MPAGVPEESAELRTQLNALIVRRTRIGLGAILAGVLTTVVMDHAMLPVRPLWADLMDTIGILLALTALGLLAHPAIRERPVPLTLTIVAVFCGMRALSGIWFGEVGSATLCVVVTLAAGATLPWGVWPQLVSVACAAAAIAANAYFVGLPVDDPPAHLIAAVVTALTLSVVLSIELERYRLRMFEENVQRRRAESDLAQLNAELERRVAGRTAELRRSQAELSTLVEHTTDSIWSVDRAGVIQAMNMVFRERFRRRFGVPYDRAISEAQLPPAIWEDMRALYERAFRGEDVQVERTFSFEGVAEHFLMSIHPIVENGVVTGATVFSKDITERKRVEAQARQHQAELAHVLRLGTMGEMAAGLAHEINQPLGAIANYAQGCVRRLRNGSLDAAGLLPVVEQIAAEALRGGAIIRRLRDLVRKEGPQQEAVDLNRLVRESTHMIEAEARQHGIHVQLDLADDLPVVSCDGIQIEQVLLNLLLNGVEAVQAAANGERILAITTTPAANGVEVAIRDSGVGVPDPPEEVFKPFFSTKPNGLGMGLSISRSIIEAHGGHLSAVRNDGCGSTFRFTLPVGEVAS